MLGYIARSDSMRLLSCRWFHPHVTTNQAQKLLMRQGRYGSFLVRPSHTNPEDFALSVRYARESVDSNLRFPGLTFVTVEYDGSGVQCRSKPWEILKVTSLPPLLPPPAPSLQLFHQQASSWGRSHQNPECR